MKNQILICCFLILCCTLSQISCQSSKYVSLYPKEKKEESTQSKYQRNYKDSKVNKNNDRPEENPTSQPIPPVSEKQNPLALLITSSIFSVFTFLVSRMLRSSSKLIVLSEEKMEQKESLPKNNNNNKMKKKKKKRKGKIEEKTQTQAIISTTEKTKVVISQDTSLISTDEDKVTVSEISIQQESVISTKGVSQAMSILSKVDTNLLDEKGKIDLANAHIQITKTLQKEDHFMKKKKLKNSKLEQEDKHHQEKLQLVVIEKDEEDWRNVFYYSFNVLLVTWIFCLFRVRSEILLQTMDHWTLLLFPSQQSVYWLGNFVNSFLFGIKFLSVVIIVILGSYIPQFGIFFQGLILLHFWDSCLRLLLYSIPLWLAQYYAFAFLTVNFPKRDSKRMILRPLIGLLSICAAVAVGMMEFRGDPLNPNRTLFVFEEWVEHVGISFYRQYFDLD